MHECEESYHGAQIGYVAGTLLRRLCISPLIKTSTGLRETVTSPSSRAGPIRKAARYLLRINETALAYYGKLRLRMYQWALAVAVGSLQFGILVPKTCQSIISGLFLYLWGLCSLVLSCPNLKT